jgi:hypothetical protein
MSSDALIFDDPVNAIGFSFNEPDAEPVILNDKLFIKGDKGDDGNSAYQDWKLIAGNENKTFAEFLEAIGEAHTHTTDEIISDPFQIITFANPLVLDATSHKDFKCASVTGSTTVNLNNTADGDSGVIELIIDATGGYTVVPGTMFTKKLGTNSIDTAANKDNFIFWFVNGTDIVYTINTI